jgi:hypothetical protein
VCRKGFYPYEWFDDIAKFKHRGLPPKEDFYSKLSGKGIKDEDYQHAQEVYKKMRCGSFLDYHLLYLKCDVLLLADIFDNFRKTTREFYGLDPANYISAPALAWDAMLLYRKDESEPKIELELISDTTILEIVERAKRGGLTFVGSKRHVKANNHLIGDFDETKPEDYIRYLDANNLYGWAMSESLPYKDIRYSNETALEEVLKTADDNETGYILEVDLEFPEKIHDLLKEYPPCPEALTPQYEWFSDFQKGLYKVVQSEKEAKEKYNGCNKFSPPFDKA